MSELEIDLFVEDAAHELLLRPLVGRVVADAGGRARIQVRNARGGHGQAIREYENYQRASLTKSSRPDIVVVGIDSNCVSFNATRVRIEEATLPEFRDLIVPACPDPHIERWYMMDRDAFQTVVGIEPLLPENKCERNQYKRALRQAAQRAGQPAPLGGIEFASEIAANLNFFDAGKQDPAFKHFVDRLRGRTKLLLPSVQEQSARNS